jgi:hypothetical protein
MQNTCVKDYQELEYPVHTYVGDILNEWGCQGYKLVNIRTVNLPFPYEDQIRILLERDLYLTTQELNDRIEILEQRFNPSAAEVEVPNEISSYKDKQAKLKQRFEQQTQYDDEDDDDNTRQWP